MHSFQVSLKWFSQNIFIMAYDVIVKFIFFSLYLMSFIINISYLGQAMFDTVHYICPSSHFSFPSTTFELVLKDPENLLLYLVIVEWNHGMTSLRMYSTFFIWWRKASVPVFSCKIKRLLSNVLMRHCNVAPIN